MLELKQVSKRYGRKTILNDFNLTVNQGEILAIVGPSGAGKTTLLRCISGLERIDSGEIQLDGKPFDPYINRDNDSVTGVVFQDFQLFPNLNVLENITLAPMLALKKDKDAARKQALDLLKRLGLDGKEQLYPYQLSGGQKQRVALARALAMQPRILCYDEPTSALDPDLRQEVEKMILGLKADGMTQLVVTHDLDFAKQIADNIKRVEAL
ncbi:amino acid ABC transporter ATP-binding protein [Loigolactobacillus backii]|uniref:Polar amino acid ABC transporter ATP-binding protein n=1 Tax=Loigolactobacillus backii TaxID=375175 RepID=A0A192H456_9LACO|nr:amino acid ABC transporter ATP-binding protein [Loigolactobacillus backii]ANK59754.1 polar amino acid ABC transporter ATP-binding protein [Loigolactobacillus backii]ANK63155.1 polar amino acid ABC transporter ATP-binding protein [Loigolactobacillus backii]ANK64749.1 polar amino acid ABC transporter ATP-binding protein [Loigolactobacillus backii]ANK66802.1 polar amino acid ABC transporter ATP-binding protein [Loigolactobacillus backii]ANK69838.1 polar amino acid ABC transporter ATP-binding p